MYEKLSQKQTGFTIVELLIVIVVIGILAAITIVVFNGIQTRAKKTQTVSAVTNWAKAIKLYQVETGALPTITSCLGKDYKSGFAEDGATTGQCRQDTATGGYQVNASFTAAMSPYISTSSPTPAFVTVGSSAAPWYRGAIYFPVAGAERLDFVLEGSSTACPSIGGMSFLSRSEYGNGVVCRMGFNG